MNNINTFTYSTLMKELELRRSNLTNQMSIPSTEDRKPMQKEIVKINSILTYMVDYKLNYLDEQPVKEPKEPKSSKNNKNKKENVSYGINGMINR